MVGPTAGAKTKRELFATTLTARVLAVGRPLEWREICSVVQTVALEVLGKKPKRHQIPWLQGHEAEKKTLDEELERARMKWALAPEEEAAAALLAKKEVASRRRRELRLWERVRWQGVGA
eukprot:6691540-Pyramimonas_sp.AAC.1